MSDGYSSERQRRADEALDRVEAQRARDAAARRSTPPPYVAPAPPAPPRQASTTTASSTNRIDPTWAWVIALVPLAGIAVTYLAPEVAVSGPAVLGLFVVSGGAAYLDSQRAAEHGHRIAWWWGLLLGIAYLIDRTKVLRSTPAIPVVWCVSVAASVLAATTFAASYTVTDDDLEPALRSWLSDQGGGNGPSADQVDIDCPETFTGRVGSTFTCEATDAINSGQFTVEMLDDGQVEWTLALTS